LIDIRSQIGDLAVPAGGRRSEPAPRAYAIDDDCVFADVCLLLLWLPDEL